MNLFLATAKLYHMLGAAQRVMNLGSNPNLEPCKGDLRIARGKRFGERRPGKPNKQKNPLSPSEGERVRERGPFCVLFHFRVVTLLVLRDYPG